MDRVYTFLLAIGIPQAVVGWLAGRRLLVVVLLGVLAWVPVIALIWLFMTLIA